MFFPSFTYYGILQNKYFADPQKIRVNYSNFWGHLGPKHIHIRLNYILSHIATIMIRQKIERLYPRSITENKPLNHVLNRYDSKLQLLELTPFISSLFHYAISTYLEHDFLF